MAKGLCDSFCKGCTFNSYVTGHENTLCTYFLTTGIRRPCPAGTGCTVKQTGRKANKWQTEKDVTWKKREENTSKETLHRVCPCCGTEFDTQNIRKIYCSRRCNMRRAQREWNKRRRENLNAKV